MLDELRSTTPNPEASLALPSHIRRIALAATAIAVACAIGAGCGGEAATVTVTEKAKERTAAEAIAAARKGVVRIDVEACGQEGNGSGFVIAPGLVATAAHVVDGASSISLAPEGGSTVDATVVGSDSGEDLALLRADGALKAKALRFHSGSDMPIGRDVIALGYPLGLPFTATRGAITGRDRDLDIEGTSYTGLFQTDAAVNPGNSGGAIINQRGDVVGVVVAGGEGYEGIGFGVPVSRARQVLKAWEESPSPQQLAECDAPPADTTADETYTEPPTETDEGTPGPGDYSGSSAFSSPTGNIDCEEFDDGLYCSTANDGYAVLLPPYGAPEADYTDQEAADGTTVPYGGTWTSPSGDFTCESAEMGITCTNQSGNGFFLNRDDYEAF